MRLSSAILAVPLLLLPLGLQAKKPRPVAVDTLPSIEAVDELNASVTVSDQGTSKRYHMDSFAHVYLDDAVASLKQLKPGMKVISVTLSDPTTLSEIKVSDAAPDAPAASSDIGTPPIAPAASVAPAASIAPAASVASVGQNAPSYFGTSAPPASPAELAELSGKLAGTYWVQTSGAWIYLTGDSRLIDYWHKSAIGFWTLVDSHTLGIKDNGNGPVQPYPLSADFTTAGPWTRLPEPKPEMADKVKAALGK
jgi:hypothetical protein